MKKQAYNEEKGQYVLQIRNINKGWDDYFTIKSQSDLDSSIRRAECCRGAGERAGAFRVVHQFMGTTVLADLTSK